MTTKRVIQCDVTGTTTESESDVVVFDVERIGGEGSKYDNTIGNATVLIEDMPVQLSEFVRHMEDDNFRPTVMVNSHDLPIFIRTPDGDAFGALDMGDGTIEWVEAIISEAKR